MIISNTCLKKKRYEKGQLPSSSHILLVFAAIERAARQVVKKLVSGSL